MVFLLTALGLLTLVLSGFLVVNTISALLAQQVRQIGVMKAVGARSRQIAGMYLVMVLVLGLLALAVAVPLSHSGRSGHRRGSLPGMVNFDIRSLQTPLWVFGVQATAALLVPLLAAIFPVRGGTRITVREAITSYGLGAGQFGRGVIDRTLSSIRGVSAAAAPLGAQYLSAQAPPGAHPDYPGAWQHNIHCRIHRESVTAPNT